MNGHKPGKSTTSTMLLSLLRMQDNNILPKWYEETTGLCFDCLEDGDLHIPSQPTCSHFYLWVEVPGQTLLRVCYWVAMFVSPEDTIFYFTTETTSPLCKLLGNKLEECVAASSVQALIHLLSIPPLSLLEIKRSFNFVKKT